MCLELDAGYVTLPLEARYDQLQRDYQRLRERPVMLTGAELDFGDAVALRAAKHHRLQRCHERLRNGTVMSTSLELYG